MINRIIYLIVFAVCLICAYAFNSYTMFLIAAAFPAAFVILWAYLLINYPYVKCTVETAGRDADRGKYFKVRVKVKMLLPAGKIRARLRFTGSFSDETEERFVVLKSGANEFMVSCAHCGMTQITLTDIRIYDPVSVFFIKKRIGASVSVSVLPTAKNISGLPPVYGGEMTDEGEYSKERPGSDASEVFELREYRDGDKPSRIHWKLSERTDSLMVKEYSLPEETRIALYADMRKCAAEQADMMLSCLMSAAVYLLEHNVVFLLAWYDNGSIISQEIEKEEELYYSLRALVKTKPYTGSRILCGDIIQKGTSVYVFTSKDNSGAGGYANVREITDYNDLI